MKSSNSIIQSLDRGLEILEQVADAGKPLSVSELAEKLSIDRSSISRLAKTLQQRGLIMHAEGSREFVLGMGLWRLANHYPWIRHLNNLASDTMKKLARETGETAHLAIREETKTIIIDVEMSNQPLGVSVRNGDEGLLHCTSVGKALIMDLEQKELDQLALKIKLVRRTAGTITDRDQLIKNLEEARIRGYTTDDEEYFDGIRCVAAPVRDNKGLAVAAVGVSAPSSRLPKSNFEILGEQVRIAAQTIGSKLKPNNYL